jgi:hypothetical protein
MLSVESPGVSGAPVPPELDDEPPLVLVPPVLDVEPPELVPPDVDPPALEALDVLDPPALEEPDVDDPELDPLDEDDDTPDDPPCPSSVDEHAKSASESATRVFDLTPRA